MLSKNEMLGAINAVRVHNSEKVIDFERSEITTNIEYIDDENDEYNVECVDMIGGDEGDGDYMECTIKVTRKEDNAVGFLTFYGYHDSWNDSYFHTIKQTVPEEKVIIVYTEIKS